MVRLDVYPSESSGTTSLGGCCDTDVEQYLNITDITAFPTAGLKVGAGVSTLGLWHYPATISNSTIATEFAQFMPTTDFDTPSTAAVINNIGGRQQVCVVEGFSWIMLTNSFLDGFLHELRNGLESNLKLSSTRMDSLGDKRFMYVSRAKTLVLY